MIPLELHFVEFRPSGSGSWIPLPGKVAVKKAVVNPENSDDQWAISIAYNPPRKNPQIISRQVVANSKKLNWEGLEFPVKLSDIYKFEKNNSRISLNVFGFEKVAYAFIISNVDGAPVALLLISDGEKPHFCWIKSMGRSLSGQLDSHEHKKFFCRRCLNHFPSQKKLNEHSELCRKKDFVKIEMDDGVVKFRNWKRKEKVPFVVYTDFECFNEKVDRVKGGRGKTQQYQKHRPCGFCCQIVCSFDQKIQFEPVLFRATSDDQDVGQIFVEMLEKEIRSLFKRFDRKKKMIFTEEGKKAFEEATSCWICGDEFQPSEKKVRDHCH